MVSLGQQTPTVVEWSLSYNEQTVGEWFLSDNEQIVVEWPLSVGPFNYSLCWFTERDHLTTVYVRFPRDH
jgi:hypothetical protein